MDFFEKEACKVIEIMSGGGVVLIPTDTIWGLSCDAYNPEAVEKINQLKQRLADKSFIVLISNLYQMDAVSDGKAGTIYANLEEMYKYSPTKATTLVSNANPKFIDPAVIRNDGTVGMRIPNYYGNQSLWMTKMMRDLMFPIVSTSANISGEAFDGSFNAVPAAIKEGVDYIFPRPLPASTQGSTLIKLTEDEQIEVLRP